MKLLVFDSSDSGPESSTRGLLTGESSNPRGRRQWENRLSRICDGNDSGPRPNPAMPAG